MKMFYLNKSFELMKIYHTHGKKFFPDKKPANKSVTSTDHNFSNGGSLQSNHPPFWSKTRQYEQSWLDSSIYLRKYIIKIISLVHGCLG